MEHQTVWVQVLKEHFIVYDIEQALYKRYMSFLTTPRSFARALCDGIKPTEVPFNLCRLYREAVYGNDPKVRARIYNCMNTIHRSIRSVEFNMQ